MIKEAIVKIVNKGDLTYDEAYTVMNEIMSGETTATQNAAFLAALSTKSARAETIDEIAGCAAAMRDHATRVDTGMDVFEIGPLPTPVTVRVTPTPTPSPTPVPTPEPTPEPTPRPEELRAAERGLPAPPAVDVNSWEMLGQEWLFLVG